MKKNEKGTRLENIRRVKRAARGEREREREREREERERDRR